MPSAPTMCPQGDNTLEFTLADVAVEEDLLPSHLVLHPKPGQERWQSGKMATV